METAYEVLGTGDRTRIATWWSEDMRWLVPGHHQMAGWWEGLDGFLEFMGRVGARTGNSFAMTRTAIMLSDSLSADVSHNVGSLAGRRGSRSVYDRLDIDVVHVLEWHEGRVVVGRGAIFGDGTSRFDQFWSQLADDGERVSG
ncbi:MAG: nuclear transport factor 2 family protein [Kineosporiaceae bacterium]